jgi:hypothetical protein
MQQKKYNSYDETKKMLSTLRKLNENITSYKTIKEQVDDTQINQQKNDLAVINDVEVNINSSDQSDLSLEQDDKNTLSQMIDNFKQQVSQIVEFEPGITINKKQIRLDGTLTDTDINFVLIAGEENGLYINSDMLKIEQDTFNILEKLIKFEDVYKSAMEALIDKRNSNI